VTVGLVVVSHSAKLAEGVVEVAAQMAPAVPLRAAGGTDDDGIGTSLGKVTAAIAALREAGHDVVVLSDLGSATMTAEAAVDLLDAGPAVRVADAPLVEGAVAAAVAAQTGGSVAEVVAAAEGAGRAAASPPAPRAGGEARVLTLVNDVGLHARPAAMLADLASRFDARVTVDGQDATSVISLLLLGLEKGATFTLAAEGPEAAEALDAIERLVAAGFPEA